MKQANLVDGELSYPCVFHAQGFSRHEMGYIMNQVLLEPIELPKDLTIVTVCDKIHINYVPLCNQLKANGIEYINLLEDYVDGNWQNHLKIKFLIDGLRQAQTDYALVLDAFDVCIQELGDILDRFNTFNKDIVFNATVNNHPKMDIDFIPNRDELGKFKYLNAGCCIGRTKSLLDFYVGCDKLDLYEQSNGSEQYIVRHQFAADPFSQIAIDNKCLIFQTLLGTEIVEHDNTNIVR